MNRSIHEWQGNGMRSVKTKSRTLVMPVTEIISKNEFSIMKQIYFR